MPIITIITQFCSHFWRGGSACGFLKINGAFSSIIWVISENIALLLDLEWPFIMGPGIHSELFEANFLFTSYLETFVVLTIVVV